MTLKVSRSHASRWDPTGDGAEIWGPFASDGRIPDSNNDRASRPGEQVSAAMAVKLTLAPGESREIPMVISWDLPVTAFASGVGEWRRYTDFFGGDGNNAAAIAAEALRDWMSWRERIDCWQEPVLNRRFPKI